MDVDMSAPRASPYVPTSLVENIGFSHNIPPMDRVEHSKGGRVHWNSNAKKQGDGWEIVHKISNKHTGIKMRENALLTTRRNVDFPEALGPVSTIALPL